MKIADTDSWPLQLLGVRHWFEPRTTSLLLISFLITLALVIIPTLLKSLFTFVTPADYEVGRVAGRDIVVERDIIYTEEEATRLRKEAVEKLVPPVFRLNEEIGASQLERFDELRRSIAKLFAEERSIDTISLKLQLVFPGILPKQELQRLHASPQKEQLLDRARTLLENLYQSGMLRLPEPDSDLFSAGSAELWRWREGKLEKEILLFKDVLTQQGREQWLKGQLKNLDQDQERMLLRLVESFSVENGFLDLDQTLKAKAKAVEAVEPVQAKLVRGQVIIRKGDIITEEAAAQIKALGELSASLSLSNVSGTALYVLIIYGFCFFLISRAGSRSLLKRNQFFFLAGLGIIYLALAAGFAYFLEPPSEMPLPVLLPTAAMSMLVALILTPQAGFVFSLIISLLLLPVLKFDFYSFLYAASSGLAGTAVVYRAQRRIDLIRAGLLLALASGIVLFSISLLRSLSLKVLLPTLLWGTANGFLCSLVTLGLLPVFEHMLNSASRFRLIELSDLNAPIMKRMLSLAPGTYSHSISVANLAESACSAMNVNTLLARVGAYYHDIGKIEQAEYFIENQDSYNKHDELKPSLSAAVIRAHVKLGIEKAKELDLPSEVCDIISQHHGRAIIKYFYQRALESEENRTVSSEEYSYPGERPKTKEAAVVMLADAVEAASRTLRKPTIAKLEKFVRNIMMDKFNSNELSECDLTLGELEIIRRSFVQVLAGYFHSRIEYPKMKEAIR